MFFSNSLNKDQAKIARRIREIEMQSDGMPLALVVGTSVNALGTVRSLGAGHIPVVWLTSNPRSHVTATRFSNYVIACDDVFDERLLDALRSLMPLFRSKPVLFLSHDDQVKLVSKQQDIFREGFRFDLPKHQVVSQLLDKKEFHDFARQLGLRTPQTILIRNSAELLNFVTAEAGHKQWVVKPPEKNDRFESLFGKALKIAHVEEWDSFANRYRGLETTILIQQWIAGGDSSVKFCLTVYDHDSRLKAAFCVRKVRQYKPEVGTGTMVEGIRDPRLHQLTLQFFSACGYVGIGSLEFKHDRETDTYYVIEPTVGRTDMNGEVAAINGCNLPAIYYFGLTDQREKCEMYSERARKATTNRAWILFRQDFRAARYYIRRRQLSVSQWLRTLMRPFTPAIFRANDPAPFLMLIGRSSFKLLKASSARAIFPLLSLMGIRDQRRYPRNANSLGHRLDQ